MQAASAALPVPEIRAVTTWNDRPVMLLEWMQGEPLLSAVIADPENAKAWGRLLGEAQARLHEIAAPAGLPSPAQSWLGHLNSELPAGADGSTLLHFDFHPLNVLVHDGQVSGVIDWTNAAAGDPRLDAARTWAILDCAPITLPNLDKKSSRHALSQFSDGWREAYEERRGPLGDIDPFFRWAHTATTRDLKQHRTGTGSKAETVYGIGEALANVTDVIKIIT
jgi:aminoglycoside phosphotransferase (APT) family kinase protein